MFITDRKERSCFHFCLLRGWCLLPPTSGVWQRSVRILPECMLVCHGLPVLTGMSCVSMMIAGTCRAERFSLMLVLTCFTSSCVSGVSGAILRKRMTRSSDPSLLLCEMHKLSTTSLIDSTVKTNNERKVSTFPKFPGFLQVCVCGGGGGGISGYFFNILTFQGVLKQNLIEFQLNKKLTFFSTVLLI